MDDTLCILFDYWNRLRAHRPAPTRMDICPADIRQILSHVFLLQRYDQARFAYRLAGSSICLLYKQEMKGQSFLARWSQAACPKLSDAIHQVMRKGQVLHVESLGSNTQGQTIGLEWMFLPLYHEQEGFSRIIGACAALETPYWVGMDAVICQAPLYINLMSAEMMHRQLNPTLEPERVAHVPQNIVALQARIEQHFGRRRPWTVLERKAATPAQSYAPNFNVVPMSRAQRQVQHLTVFEGGQQH